MDFFRIKLYLHVLLSQFVVQFILLQFKIEFNWSGNINCFYFFVLFVSLKHFQRTFWKLNLFVVFESHFMLRVDISSQ